MAKKDEIAKAILYTIAAVGIIAVAIAAPNLIGVLGRYSKTKEYKDRQLKRSLRKLEQNELISISEQEGKTVVRLTKKGEEKLLKYKIEEIFIPKPKKWDRKWRLVIFDIPEKFKVNRTIFSRKLKELEFFQLQKSVWVCPYPCEDEIDFIKEIYEIRRFVRIVTAEYIDMEFDLLKKFNLS